MHAPPLHLTDYVIPPVAALVFVLVMSLVKEPTRRNLNVILATGATGAYITAGSAVGR